MMATVDRSQPEPVLTENLDNLLESGDEGVSPMVSSQGQPTR